MPPVNTNPEQRAQRTMAVPQPPAPVPLAAEQNAQIVDDGINEKQLKFATPQNKATENSKDDDDYDGGQNA